MSLGSDLTMISFLKKWFANPPRFEAFGDVYCRVCGVDYHQLYDCLARLPGAVFARKPYSFWTGMGVYVEFALRGHTFQIKGDPFDEALWVFDEALWVAAKDGRAHPEEMRDIREHLERFITAPSGPAV